MAELSASFGDERWASVWSVDDAWFEGSSTGTSRSLSIADEISLKHDGDYDGLLNAIRERREAENLDEVTLKTEFDYLETLVQLCKENSFRLVLCNFEYFEKEYSRANSGKTAVLLDINYSTFRRSDKKSRITGETYTANNYGIFLLADLLNGQRSRADIFFVTSYPKQADSVRSTNRINPLWWPLKAIPFISKASTQPDDPLKLKDELDAFAKYFKQGIEKDPVRVFSYALLQAQAFSHPEPDIDTAIPSDFPLRGEFMLDGGGGLECESFKALYNTDGTEKARGGRYLLTRIFRKHLEYAGINVSVDEGTFKLPVEPGMLFVLCLADLHRSLNLREETIELKLKKNGSRAVARMNIPLRNSESFAAAFFARETDRGESVNALRRLLACKERVFQKAIEVDQPQAQELIAKWTKPRLIVGENARDYAVLMKPIITSGTLTIEWEYD